MRRSQLWILVSALSAASLVGCGRGREGDSASGPGADSTQTLRRRIASLEGARSFGAGELQRHLTHPDARVRKAAAVALGRIQDLAALDALLPVLDDPDTAVAIQAAFAIGQLQGWDDAHRYRAQAPIVARVADNPIASNAVYIETLGKLGGAEIVPVLEQNLASGMLAGMGSEARDPILEGMAALGMARTKRPDARAFLAAVGDLRNRDVRAAWRIGAAMQSDPDTVFIAPCVSLLDHPHPFARAQGARSLGRIGSPRAFRPLVQHLADLDWEVRASILTAIAELADRRRPDPEAFDFCASLAGDQHPLVREAAIAALDSFGVGKHARIVRERLADSAPAVRLWAMRALARAEGAKVRSEWEAARRDSVDFVRAGVLEVASPVFGAGAFPILVEAAKNPSARERAAAVSALGALPSDRAPRNELRTVLEASLADADFVVAASAAEALGTQRSTASIPALAAAYDAHGTRHEDVDIRLAAVTAVGDMGTGARAAATPFLTRARKDIDPRVAQAALDAETKLAGREPAPAPPPRARAVAVPASLDSLPSIDLGTVLVRLVTSHGEAILELDGDAYPRTVGNFLRLVDAGFYAKGVFHRVVPSFVVQGGCPRGDGWGDAGWTIPCEYGDRRYDDAGVVGMAHAGKDTGGSQFFITHVPVPRLDGRYTAFGKVRDGMETIDRIVRGDSFRIERLEPAARR